MKKCIKGVISILICLVFVAGSVSIGLNSITAKVYNSWQEAYLNILQSDRNNYYYEDAKSVLIYNLIGNSTPELAYPCSSKDYCRSLRIVTFDGNNIKELYRQYEWLLYGGSGSKNCLAALNDGRLATYHYIGSDYTSETYKILKINNDSISEAEEYTCYWSYDYVNERDESKFTVNGSSATEESCKKKIDLLKQSISKVLLGHHYEDFYKSPIQGNIPGMTYDEAITYLKNQKSNSTPSNSVQLKLSDISGGYVFSSGAGAWSSELNIYKDGSFDGQYSDTDMAPPTTYYSTYNGKFGTPKKVDEYSYSIKIENLNITNDLHILYGDDYDKMYSKEVKYVPSKPYGVDKTTELIVYPPFTPLSKMATECANSLGLWLTKGESTLPKDAYVLYNSAEGAAFYRTVKEVKKSTIGNDEGNKPGKYSIEYLDGTSDTFDHNLDYYISKADSTKYDPELAYILMSIAYAAYSEDTVKDMFETLEFTQINTSHETYIESNEVKMLENKIRYGLGAKTMSNGKTLVLIDIAGTNGDPLRNGDYLGPSGEWLSDLDLGFITQLSATGYHHGFEQAADYLIKGLNSFLSTNNIKKSEAIFAVTGHSRGAAVGNIVSCKLGVKKSNLYNYNFACPDVAVDTGVYWNLNGAHDNIFNISCNQDIVSMVPGYLGDLGIIIAINQWGKYGKSLWFCHDWSDMKYGSIKLSSHEQNNYLKYLRQKRPESELKDYFAMKANIPNPLKWNGKIFGFLCPVDVKLTDDNGKVIAEVINNKITQKDENVFIIINQDHKIVIVPDTEHTNVQITGTDEGEMTLLMRNFDSNSRNVTDSVDFKNVEVHKDKTILTEWGGNIKSTDTVLKDGETGEIINADKAEDSVKNDSVGEKKDNKTALYIIIAVAAAAAIAAVTAVIIIKKRKSKKNAETVQKINPEYENAGYEPAQNENAYTTPPSPPIQPVNSANGAETAEKKPEKLVKYACKPTGRPGQCAKCKSDTAQLYFIVAEKSGKRQSITVCKDCAEKIITRFKKQNQESDRT